MPATRPAPDDISAKLVHALQGDLTIYNFAQSDSDRSETIDGMSNLIERTGLLLRAQDRTVQLERCNLAELTQEVISDLGKDRVYCECTSMRVDADRQLIKTLIYEIIDNAYKFSEGEIVTTLHETDGYAVLRVEDFGDGLSQAVVNSIAEPFITTTDDRSGHGLGLALAWAIVQAHDGAMTVLTEPGQGTTVIVCLDLV